jgi:hypothetical protein
MEKIVEEISERLHIEPSRIFVERIIRTCNNFCVNGKSNADSVFPVNDTELIEPPPPPKKKKKNP